MEETVNGKGLLFMETDFYYIAEFNISRLKAPLDSPIMKEFVDFLAPVNRFGEQTPGFIWRLATPDGQPSTYLPPAYPDNMIVTNLTVWKDIESLKYFVYHTVHSYFLRNRKQWFDQFIEQRFVLWWVHQNHRPVLEEAKQKLLFLQENGPTSHAFTLQAAFDSHGNKLKSNES
jgi:hypothetical protein